MLAYKLLVGPLPKVHYKVGRVDAHRLSHAQQVTVLVDESHMLLASACLDNARGS